MLLLHPRRPASTRSVALTLTGVILLAVAGAGCGSDRADAPGAALDVFDVTAAPDGNEYAFATPSTTIAAGPIRMGLVNKGREEHQIEMVRVHDGLTAAEVITRYQQDPTVQMLYDAGDVLSGPNAVAPDATVSADVTVDPGEYVMFCLIPAPDGVPHAAKGMLQPLTVTGKPGTQPFPIASDKVSLVDFGFQAPTAVAAGAELSLTNTGDQPHEMAWYRLPEGQTVESYVAAGLPPGLAIPAGGISALVPSRTAFISAPQEPGEYAILCFLPDVKGEGAPHFSLGMRGQITVTASGSNDLDTIHGPPLLGTSP